MRSVKSWTQFFHYTNFSHSTHYLREEFKMNTKLATSRMRTGIWADIIKDCKGEWSKSRWLLCAAWPLQKCLLLLASKGKGSRPYAKWICGSTTTGGGFLLLSISKVNSVRKRNSFRDWRKHADGFTGKCYKCLEKCLTMLPDSNTFTSVPDTQTLDVVLTALSQ